MEQRPICNQSACICRAALRKRSCSLVLYLLCELTEIIFLNGIKSEGELHPGQYSINLADRCLGATSPTEYIPKHSASVSIQKKQMMLLLGMLDPHFEKAFKYLFLMVLNYLSATFLQVLVGIIKSGTFQQDLSLP